MSFLSNARDALAPGGKDGLASTERRDPTGCLVAGLTLLAQAPVLDRLGLRATAEDTVFRLTSVGFTTLGAWARDSRILDIFEGTQQIQQLTARAACCAVQRELK